MKSIFNFIVKPIGEKYNNTIKAGETNLILNTSYEDHKFVNRFAEIVSAPLASTNAIKKGDTILVHHNVFRTWYDVRGNQKRSSSYIDQKNSFCNIDQIYAVLKKDGWKPLPEYCFVAPVVNTQKISNEKEKEFFGIMKINNEALKAFGIKNGDLVSFTPSSEFEFLLNDQKLYRIRIKDITATYGHPKNEIQYNPSWRKSSGRTNKSS